MAYLSHSHSQRNKLACEKLLTTDLHAARHDANHLDKTLIETRLLSLENFDFKIIEQTNFLLFQKLQFLAQKNILEAMTLSGLKREMLMKLSSCSAYKLSQLCCSHFCNFVPQRSVSQSFLQSEDFSLTYWLSVWNLAASTPFRASLCFHLSGSEVEKIGKMDAAQIVEYAKEPINRRFTLAHSEALLDILVDHNDDFFKLLQIHHLLSLEDENELFNPTTLEEPMSVKGKAPTASLTIDEQKHISQLLHLAGVQRIDIMNFLKIGKSTCISFLREFEGITETLSKRLTHDIHPKHFWEAIPTAIFTKLYHRLAGNSIFKDVHVRAFLMASVLTHDIIHHHKLKSLCLSGYVPHGSKLFDLALGLSQRKVTFEYCYRTRSFYPVIEENSFKNNNFFMRWANHDCSCPFCQGFNFLVKPKNKEYKKISNMICSPYDPYQFDEPDEGFSDAPKPVLKNMDIPFLPFNSQVQNPLLNIQGAVADD